MVHQNFKIQFILILLLLTSLPALTQKPQKYRWPLNINNGYSSSFQEFRSNHFHGGLDFRTFQKTGYPVYAIADGHVKSIRVVKRGSGRGLYFKQTDGNWSIFYHLDRFETKLAELELRVRKLKGHKYFGNYELKKPIFYKRGQVIAYSGETGSGFPHLHLEIRDKYYYAINPFKRIAFPSPDRNAPILKGMLIRNRGDHAVNGQVGEQYIKFRGSGRRTFNATKPVVITGPFDMVLNTLDISDTGRFVAPWQISVNIDEHHYYNLTFERFRWEDNNQLGFVYDMQYSSSSAFYINLFQQPGFSLESRNISLAAVVDSLDYGEHRVKINVKDNFDNISTGTLVFHKLPKPLMEISETRNNKGSLDFTVQKLNAHGADRIDIRMKNSADKTVFSGRLKYTQLDQPKTFTLNGAFDTVRFIDFDFIKNGVTYARKRFPLKTGWLANVTDIQFDTFINRDDVFIKINSPGFSPDNLRLTVRQGDIRQAVTAQSGAEGLFFRFTPLNRENRVWLHFSIMDDERKDNELKLVEIQKQLLLIHLQKGIQQTFKYNEFSSRFDIKSVYEPKVLIVEERNYKSGYPVLSRQISLSPFHFPFLDKVYYSFTKELPNPRQVGIFKYNQKNKSWSYRHTTYDATTKTFRRKVLSSGVYALMRDEIPPRVYLLKHSKYKKNLKRLVVKITDKGKGVDDNTLELYINGKRVHAEYDPDWRTVNIEDLRFIKTGKNYLKVIVRDYGFNLTTRTFPVYLK